MLLFEFERGPGKRDRVNRLRWQNPLLLFSASSTVSSFIPVGLSKLIPSHRAINVESADTAEEARDRRPSAISQSNPIRLPQSGVWAQLISSRATLRTLRSENWVDWRRDWQEGKQTGRPGVEMDEMEGKLDGLEWRLTRWNRWNENWVDCSIDWREGKRPGRTGVEIDEIEQMERELSGRKWSSTRRRASWTDLGGD
jgi:hypothetical protein